MGPSSYLNTASGVAVSAAQGPSILAMPSGRGAATRALPSDPMDPDAGDGPSEPSVMTVSVPSIHTRVASPDVDATRVAGGPASRPLASDSSTWNMLSPSASGASSGVAHASFTLPTARVWIGTVVPPGPTHVAGPASAGSTVT